MDEIAVFRKDNVGDKWTRDDEFLEKNSEDVLQKFQEGLLTIVRRNVELSRGDIIALIWPEREKRGIKFCQK